MSVDLNHPLSVCFLFTIFKKELLNLIFIVLLSFLINFVLFFATNHFLDYNSKIQIFEIRK